MDANAKDVTARSAAAALGALIGGVAGGPAGAMAGAAAGPILEPIMARVWDECSADSRASSARVFEAASEAADFDAEELADAAMQDEQRRLLAALALASGSRTRNRAKIRALGRALAAGVLTDDDAELDDEQLIIRALDDLEAPHIAVLNLLVGFTPGGHPYTGPDQTDPGAPSRRWTLGDLAHARPGLRGGLVGILGTLQRHGLAREDPNIRKTFEEYSRALGAQERDPLPTIRTGFDRPRYPLPRTFRSIAPEWVPTPLGERVHAYLTEEGQKRPLIETGDRP